MTDPVADYLAGLRNVIKAKHRVTEVSVPNLKREIIKVLFDRDYILSFKFVEDGPQGTIKIALKYDLVDKASTIKEPEEVSTPGLCKYVGYKGVSRVLNGLGIAVLSASRGVVTGKEARDLEIGDGVLCYVY